MHVGKFEYDLIYIATLGLFILAVAYHKICFYNNAVKDTGFCIALHHHGNITLYKLNYSDNCSLGGSLFVLAGFAKNCN